MQRPPSHLLNASNTRLRQSLLPSHGIDRGSRRGKIIRSNARKSPKVGKGNLRSFDTKQNSMNTSPQRTLHIDPRNIGRVCGQASAANRGRQIRVGFKKPSRYREGARKSNRNAFPRDPDRGRRSPWRPFGGRGPHRRSSRRASSECGGSGPPARRSRVTLGRRRPGRRSVETPDPCGEKCAGFFLAFGHKSNFFRLITRHKIWSVTCVNNTKHVVWRSAAIPHIAKWNAERNAIANNFLLTTTPFINCPRLSVRPGVPFENRPPQWFPSTFLIPTNLFEMQYNITATALFRRIQNQWMTMNPPMQKNNYVSQSALSSLIFSRWNRKRPPPQLEDPRRGGV